jgi:diguanylate cyclase (GGDEF)-like protein
MPNAPSERDCQSHADRPVSKLKLSSAILLASILLQALPFTGLVSGGRYLSLILGAIALIAFAACALQVTRILSAIRVATAQLLDLAGRPPIRSAAARAADDDAIVSLLAIPGRIARSMESVTSEIERLREIDPITGLGNLWWLRTKGRQEFARAGRENSPISMVVVRLNRLPEINFEFGQHAGNMALLAVADTLRDFVRPYDLVGRVAAEEFGLILPGVDLKAATEISARLQSAIAGKTVAPIGDRPVSASVAVVERQTGDSWFDEFLARGEHRPEDASLRSQAEQPDQDGSADR